MIEFLRSRIDERHGNKKMTSETIQRARLSFIRDSIRWRLLNVYWLQHGERFSRAGDVVLSTSSPENLREIQDTYLQLKRVIERGFDNVNSEEAFKIIYGLCVNDIPPEIAIIENGEDVVKCKSHLEKIYKAIVNEDWLLITPKYSNSVTAYGFFLSCIFDTVLKDYKCNTQTQLLITELEALVPDFFFMLGAKFPNFMMELERKASSIKNKKRYSKSGNTRRATTDKKDHYPVARFIKSEAEKGAFVEFAGKMPGGLAREIRDGIRDYNKGQKDEEKRLHPYSEAILKKILENYFGFKQGEKLPSQLTFKIIKNN